MATIRVIGVKIDGRLAKQGAVQVQRALRDIENTGKKTAKGIQGVGRAIFSLKTAFATLGVGLVTRELVQAATGAQRIERGLKQATGSAAGAQKAMAFLDKEIRRLNLNMEAAEKGFVGIAAAAKGTSLEGAEAQNIFLGVSEAATALGLSADQTQGALTAIEQIISKGKVSAEELRGQLGERLPGAFQIAARAAGMTTAELDKMLADGKLLAEDFIPLLARQLRQEFKGSAEEAANSLQGSINSMSNAILRFKRRIAASDAMEPLARAIQGITKMLDDPDFLKGAEKAANALGQAMLALAENIDLVGIALAALAAGKAASLLIALAGGALKFARGIKLATAGAIAAAGAMRGLGAAMAALRVLGLAAAGPAGWIVGIGTALYMLAGREDKTEKASADLRAELDQLSTTKVTMNTAGITAKIAQVEDALKAAKERVAETQAALDQLGEKQESSRGRNRGGATQRKKALEGDLKAQGDDVAYLEGKLKELQKALADLGSTGGETDEELEKLRAAFKDKLSSASDDLKDKIKDAREELQGMRDDLRESVDTFGESDTAVLNYRLTLGDLADDVALLGDEGDALVSSLLGLQSRLDSLDKQTEANKDAQETYKELFDETRTSAEAYELALKDLAKTEESLRASGALTEEQLAQLPEVMERARKEAKKTADESKDSFSAMEQFAIQAARSMQSAMSDLFFSVMQGEFDDLADNFKRTIDRMVADFLASQLLSMVATSAAGSTNPALAAIGAVVAGGGTGGARAEGGPTQRGMTHLVGERGPELFTPQENGTIIPNRAMGSMRARAAMSGRQAGDGASLDRMPTFEHHAQISRGLGGVDGETERLTTGRTIGQRWPGRAQGGPVMAGQPVVAGEVGPEVFVGKGGDGGGAAPINLHMTINTPNADTFRQSQGQILADMNRLLAGARLRNG